jgi:hypothetical protein
MISFVTKNWVWVIVAILVVYLVYTNKKKKEIEAKAVAAYNKINSLIAKAKQGPEFEKEKASLLNLLKNVSAKEREVLTDLLNGSMAVFTTAEQAKDKEKERKDFPGQIAKMQSDLIAKHGKANVMSLKAKMDKYGFDL